LLERVKKPSAIIVWLACEQHAEPSRIGPGKGVNDAS
jgi:hypothetical protein